MESTGWRNNNAEERRSTRYTEANDVPKEVDPIEEPVGKTQQRRYEEAVREDSKAPSRRYDDVKQESEVPQRRE